MLSQPSRSRRFQEFGLAPRGQAGASPPLLPAAARATCSAAGPRQGRRSTLFPLPRGLSHGKPARRHRHRPRRRAGRGRQLSGPAHPAPLAQDGARHDPARPSGPGAMPVAPCPQTRGGVGRSRARLGCAQEGKAVQLGPTPAGGCQGPTGAGEGPRQPQSGPGSRPVRAAAPGPEGVRVETAGSGAASLGWKCQRAPLSRGHRPAPRKTESYSGRTKGCPFLPFRRGNSPLLRWGHPSTSQRCRSLRAAR